MFRDFCQKCPVTEVLGMSKTGGTGWVIYQAKLCVFFLSPVSLLIFLMVIKENTIAVLITT